MKGKIKVAVIGGCGKSGKYLVRELINRNIHFKLLLRNQQNFQINTPLAKIIQGDARNYAAIEALTAGCRAIISTLGQPKDEPPVFSQATSNIIQCLNESKYNRYVVTTGLQVDTPFDNKSVHNQLATEWMKEHYPATTADKQSEYDALTQSSLQWTLVRLPLIDLTAASSEIIISTADCPGNKISAASLAAFLTDQLFDDNYIKQAPFIANR